MSISKTYERYSKQLGLLFEQGLNKDSLRENWKFD